MEARISIRNLISENEHLENLLPKKKKEKKHKDYCFKRLFAYLFPQKQTVPRRIHLSGKVHPPNYFENKVENRKYSIITFVPSVLYNQFKFFFNMFYLLLSISQFFDALKVGQSVFLNFLISFINFLGLLFTYIAPLAFVLILTMLKEAYDDLKRYLKDKEANSTKYRLL